MEPARDVPWDSFANVVRDDEQGAQHTTVLLLVADKSHSTMEKKASLEIAIALLKEGLHHGNWPVSTRDKL
jgi:hypothetical protein